MANRSKMSLIKDSFKTNSLAFCIAKKKFCEIYGAKNYDLVEPFLKKLISCGDFTNFSVQKNYARFIAFTQ